MPWRARTRFGLGPNLRTTLVCACLQDLEPDLIILDEFQRFKHLLVDNNESEREMTRICLNRKNS
jgi:hypothetical protein